MQFAPVKMVTLVHHLNVGRNALLVRNALKTKHALNRNALIHVLARVVRTLSVRLSITIQFVAVHVDILVIHLLLATETNVSIVILHLTLSSGLVVSIARNGRIIMTLLASLYFYLSLC